MSDRALRSLDSERIAAIAAHLRILPLAIPTIERAGGSVRCMLAGIHLAPRPEVAGEGARSSLVSRPRANSPQSTADDREKA
ncbi:MAG: hypothetical protein GX458_11080 [Phyllobacteriaceae bacterium]|nr:hypothetical protein [Phyllobacteriaceae bacterium]